MQPCLNGATCANSFNNYYCSCAFGYTGTECSIGKGNISLIFHLNVIGVTGNSLTAITIAKVTQLNLSVLFGLLIKKLFDLNKCRICYKNVLSYN